MINWLNRLFSIGSKKQITTEAAKIVHTVEAKAEPAITKNRSYAPSLGSKLSYGKWYYGVDTKALPTVKRTPNGIEKRYPCLDGGELIASYGKRTDGSSYLNITKVGNPEDINKGDWYRSFYSDTAVKHYTDMYGDNITSTVKKKGATKQILSTKNGQPTEDVHVPLKRWEIIESLFGRKKENNCINPWNPEDFGRFID